MSNGFLMPREVPQLSPSYWPSPPPLGGIRSNLDDVAFHLRTMPYGEFHELAEAIGADLGKMWMWAMKRF